MDVDYPPPRALGTSGVRVAILAGAHMPDPSSARLRLGVVLYRNEPTELARLVRSLEANRNEPGTPEFVTDWIDNSPTPRLGGVLKTLGESAYRHSGTNLGFGAAHNLLMKDAFARGADHYICVNPDSILHPASLAELVRVADADAGAGLVEARQFPDEHPKPYDPLSGATAWCSGCVLLVTRALHRRIGGFDEGFFMYCEDVDLSWRARAAGFSTLVASRALVHHYTGDRPPGGNVATMMLRSGAYLAAKYGDRQFLQHCRNEYVALTGTPLAPRKVEPPDNALRAVADFRHMFHFAEARW